MSLSSIIDWDKEQLLSFVRAHDVTDTDEMEESELRALCFALQDMRADETSRGVDTTSDGAPIASASASTAVASGTEASGDGQGVEADQAAPLPPLDETQMDMLTNYCAFTGSEPEMARHMLSVFNWDLDTAVSMYMESGEAEALPPAASARSNATGGMPSYYGRVPPYAPPSSGGEGVGRMTTMGRGDYDDEEQEEEEEDMLRLREQFGGGEIGGQGYRGTVQGWSRGSGKDEYDEFGVRKPDDIRRTRLQGGGARYGDIGVDDPLSRADKPGVDWMFPPPRHLSYQGSLQEARDLAMQDRKWLVVNIQSHTEFSSQMLNRDTWTNEMVETLLRSNFVFWQRGHTSTEGMAFMQLHTLSETDLPHIAIIDSRTGARIVTIKGFMRPDDFTTVVMEFLEENSFDRMLAPKLRHFDLNKREKKAGGEEDEEDEGEDEIQHQEDMEKMLRERAAQSAVVQEQQAQEEQKRREEERARQEEQRILEEALEAERIRNDYGPPPDEPLVLNDSVLKVMVKLASGKKVERRFNKTDPVRALYAFVKATIASSEDTAAVVPAFEILQSFPVKALVALDMTLAEAGVSGQLVVVRFIV